MNLSSANDHIFTQLQPFVVATKPNLACFNSEPFGLRTRWHIDPQRVASATFLHLLQVLDGLTFGPEGMPMDKWVFYNCAEVPGFIYGFALDASDLTPHEAELMQVPMGYSGPVPFSMYIAIPMEEEGGWFGHNLASLNRTFPERGLAYLGTVTKAIALKAFGVRRFVGATQWLSKALYIHTRFGPLDLLTAWTPAHSTHETLTYAFDVSDALLRHAAGDPAVEVDYPAATELLGARDCGAMKRLQSELEGGARYALVGPPQESKPPDAPAGGDALIVHPLRRLG